jgi:F0F1-type ATP synthase epsilon subunit
MAEDAPAQVAEEKPAEEPKSKSGKPSMDVKVYAPFQVYFEGEAFSVSTSNATGPFDILPEHHNFLCMLVPCTLTVQPVEGPAKSIKIHRALMHVKADRVVVFMDV